MKKPPGSPRKASPMPKTKTVKSGKPSKKPPAKQC